MQQGLSGEVFKTDECEVFRSISPYHWKKHNLTVVADRMLPDGTRQHLVLEDIDDCVLDNAQIFSIKNYSIN